MSTPEPVEGENRVYVDGMDIVVTVGGVERVGRWPYRGCLHVEVPGSDCAVCAGKVSLLEGSRVVALATPGPGLTAARREFPRAFVVPKPPPAGSLKVRMPDFSVGFDEYTGTAVCARCQSPVGPMVVKVSTLFGLEEDERVLNGRCRVY